MIYDEQPIDFTPDMEVVACLVEHNNKILLLHRHAHKPEGNKWGLPGGKIDKDDINSHLAMLRELREETGIDQNIEDLNFHKTFFVSHLGLNFFYHYFYLKLNGPHEVIISEGEHKAYRWVTPDEALKLSLVLDEDHCLKDYYGIK